MVSPWLGLPCPSDHHASLSLVHGSVWLHARLVHHNFPKRTQWTFANWLPAGESGERRLKEEDISQMKEEGLAHTGHNTKQPRWNTYALTSTAYSPLLIESMHQTTGYSVRWSRFYKPFWSLEQPCLVVLLSWSDTRIKSQKSIKSSKYIQCVRGGAALCPPSRS